jgi:hypothetical protein
VLSNLYYDKTTRLPPLRDGAAWRILLAVQESRSDSKLMEVLVALEAHYDPTGRKAASTFQEWMELRNPSLRLDRLTKEARTRKNLDLLYKMGPVRVAPVRSSLFQARRYAEELTHRTT